MSVSQNTDRPPCFGTQWDPKAPECRGGPDPSYVNPQTGGNVRRQCDFFTSCGTKTQADRMASVRTQQQQQVIPPQNLVRPEQHRFQIQHQPQPQYTAPIQPSRPVAPAPAPVYQQAPGHMSIPVQHEHFHPTHYQPLPVNYSIPGYLTVPETRNENEGMLGYAGRSILRSMLKGGAHGLAHLIDTTPLRSRRKKPEE